MGINKDQVEGHAKEAAGKVQEVAGKAVGSVSEQAKGMANQVAGKTQSKFGDAKETVKENYKDEKARQDAQRKDTERRP
ncbi:MAG: CsbD family protein [Steroidobacteraceae bacterium]